MPASSTRVGQLAVVLHVDDRREQQLGVRRSAPAPARGPLGAARGPGRPKWSADHGRSQASGVARRAGRRRVRASRRSAPSARLSRNCRRGIGATVGQARLPPRSSSVGMPAGLAAAARRQRSSTAGHDSAASCRRHGSSARDGRAGRAASTNGSASARRNVSTTCGESESMPELSAPHARQTIRTPRFTVRRSSAASRAISAASGAELALIRRTSWRSPCGSSRPTWPGRCR